MPIYEYECPGCSKEKEVTLKVSRLDKETILCEECNLAMNRRIGNKGGFRLGQNGTVAWSDGGYGSTHGDIENFKAGRKVYE